MIFFFLAFFCTAAIFTDFDSNMSGHNRYVVDIDRYFLIFPLFDYSFLISCREGPTPEISKIYRDIFVHDGTLVSAKAVKQLVTQSINTHSTNW